MWRPVPVHSHPPPGSARPQDRFQAHDPDHDPSRVQLGRGNGGSFRRAGRGHGGCPMTAADLPLSLAAGVPRVASHAINLTPITAGKQASACGSGHTGTFGRTHRHRMCPDMFHSRQYHAEGFPVPAMPRPPPDFIRGTLGIPTTTGFRGCPVGHRLNFARQGAGVKTDQQTRPWQHRPRSGRRVLWTLARLKAGRPADIAIYARILAAIDRCRGAHSESAREPEVCPIPCWPAATPKSSGARPIWLSTTRQ
jgi:hypothetical protein